jgi:hypothetical protein
LLRCVPPSFSQVQNITKLCVASPSTYFWARQRQWVLSATQSRPNQRR